MTQNKNQFPKTKKGITMKTQIEFCMLRSFLDQ